MFFFPDRRCAGVGSLAVLAFLASTTASWGVSVTTSTYATQTNPPTVTAQNPLKTLTNSTSISASVRSDENGPALTAAHAQAWASAQVTSTGVVKSASGKGWLDPVAPTVKGQTWSSSASGSRYVVNGPPGQMVPFQFQVGIPSSQGSLDLTRTGLDPTQNLPSDLPISVLSFSRVPVPAGNTFSSSFFDLFFALDVAVTQDGVTHPIFNGQINFGLNGQTTTSGDSFSSFLTFNNQSNGALDAHFADQFNAFPQVQIVPNDPFDLTFVETMRMGQGVTVGGVNSFPNLVEKTGGGGSFTGTFGMAAGVPASYTLHPLPVRGDFDFNGLFDVADVELMKKAMSDQAAFQLMNSTQLTSAADLGCLGDINGDGQFNNLDIQGEINLVASGGAGSVAAVPEPGSQILLVLGGILIFAGLSRRYRVSSL